MEPIRPDPGIEQKPIGPLGIAVMLVVVVAVTMFLIGGLIGSLFG